MSYVGECFCGSVALEVSGEPEETVVLDGSVARRFSVRCLARLFLRARHLTFVLRLVLLKVLLTHEVGASSSTTSYSPSSTTSSSDADSPLPPLADACACAVASA